MQSRQGMRVGRVKFRAGDVDLAIRIWTKALESAYTTQDYAAMYVLSKNLGDAFGRLTSSNQKPVATTAAIEALQKSIDYYKYALNVIDECALLDVLGDASHLVLNRSAGHVQTTLERQEMRMEALRKLPPAIEALPCTTCEELFEHLVLDSSDGCLYCQVCYDAFYSSSARADHETSPATPEEAQAQEPAYEIQIDAKVSNSSESPETKGEHHEDAIEDPINDMAEVVSYEAATKAVGTASAISSTTESGAEPVEKIVCEDTGDDTPPQSSSETTARTTIIKQVYSIPELLALRVQSTSASCPDAILASPVARGVDVACSTSGSARPVDRKHNQQPKSSIKSKKIHASPVSKSDRPSSSLLSALPSAELCNLLRSTSTVDLQRMAVALFDSNASGQTAGDGDATSPCRKDTFASDAALFATILRPQQ